MKHLNARLIGFVALVIVLLGVLGGTILYDRRQNAALERQLREEAEDIDYSPWTADNTVYLDGELYGFDHRIESFLFVGTDNSGNESGVGADFHGAMADYMLLMVLDHSDNTIGYLQIDRNTITEVDMLNDQGKYVDSRDMQICTAHWYGTDLTMCAENTVEAVKKLLGELEYIDGYYIISMKDIGALNHAVGGVQITLQEDMTNIDPKMTAGATVTLNDKQAEQFLRARMNQGQGTNKERMGRQRQYMEGLLNKVRANAMSDSQYANELWKMIREIAVTDMNGNAFSRIANKMIKGEDKGILELKGDTELGTVLGDGIEHEEFYPDSESILSVMKTLYSLVPTEGGTSGYDEEEAEDESEDEEEDESGDEAEEADGAEEKAASEA